VSQERSVGGPVSFEVTSPVRGGLADRSRLLARQDGERHPQQSTGSGTGPGGAEAAAVSAHDRARCRDRGRAARPSRGPYCSSGTSRATPTRTAIWSSPTSSAARSAPDGYPIGSTSCAGQPESRPARYTCCATPTRRSCPPTGSQCTWWPPGSATAPRRCSRPTRTSSRSRTSRRPSGWLGALRVAVGLQNRPHRSSKRC
jgi:hypothetical protein